jgi:ribonuclease HI
MKQTCLTIDGSCLQNPGPGGWASILRYGASSKELFGYDPDTTNNRMELMAAIQGLLAFNERCEIEITTDSLYVTHGIERLGESKRRGWWKGKHPVPNADLWMELDELVNWHQTRWVWTKGHADHEDNNRCDFLAKRAARKQSSSWPDNRPQQRLKLNLGRDYLPPRQSQSVDILEALGIKLQAVGN